ncbi:MAG: hypothetical protein FWC80_05685, partial [Firmicutes bacterium]|nr:hypothetical protein [Bacillota bacterium]
IKAYQGCDGGKTGFTGDAMHCLSSTAVRNGMRAIAVVVGAPDSKVRFFENSELLNDMFGNYETKVEVIGGVQFGDPIEVSNSKEKQLAVMAREDLAHFDRKRAGKELTTEVTLNVITAPIVAGDVVGTVTLKADGTEVSSTDLVAMNDINKLGYLDMIDEFVKKWN